MAIELIHFVRVRPRLDHFHRDEQMVCERCMSKLASSGSPLYDAFSEYVYVSKQLLFIFAESTFQLAGWLLNQTRENIYIANEILLIVAKFVLFASMGIGMLVAALCPSLAGGKSAQEEELDRQFRAKKQREWEERQKEIEEFKKTRDKVNSAMYNSPKILTSAESAEDEYLVNRVNNSQNGVENGTVDAEEARKDADEVLKHRRETAKKDARRQDLLSQCRDKDWEAHKDRVAGDKARDEGDEEEADKCYRRADAAQAKANGLYYEFLSV